MKSFVKYIKILLLTFIPYSNLIAIEVNFHELPKLAFVYSTDFYLQGKAVDNIKVTYVDYLIGFLPTLGISYERGLEVKTEQADEGPNSLLFYINQPLLKKGEFFSDLERKNADHYIAFWNLEKKKLTQILEVQKIYLDILINKQSIIINQQLLKTLASELEITKKRLELNEIVENDFLEILSQYQETELDIIRQKIDYREKIKNLRLTLEIPPKEKLVIKENLTKDFQILKQDVNLLPFYENYLRENLDLRIIKFEIKKNTFLKDKILWNMIPSINLNAYYNLKGDTISGISAWNYPLHKRDWGIRLDIAFELGQTKISSSGLVQENIDERTKGYSLTSKADIFEENIKNVYKEYSINANQQNILYRRMEKLYDQLESNFNTTLENLNLTYKLLKLQKLKIKTDEKRLEILYQQYLLGETKITEFLKKRVEHRNLESDYYQQLASYISMASNLELNLGFEPGFFKLFKTTTQK